jgi:hypothetical protein
LVTKHKTDLKSGRLVVYSLPDDGPFRMGFAKNMAHRLGMLEGADILVNLDADNFTGNGFAACVAERFQYSHTPGIFLAANIIPGQGRQFRGCNGRIVVTAHQFLNAGGYDERFDTWAPDDKDFNARLQRLGYTAIEIPRDYLRSVVHGDGQRFQEYPHAREKVGEYEQEMENPSDATIANYGRVGVGTVYRNFDPTTIELGPVPTRIFGIGMHKTATNSLHKALTALGYDSAHWKSARWAKRIWREMTTTGRSVTLEQSYAVSDLPITILYKELDQAYPGSKFILTVRDEQKWLASVRNHWSNRNQFRSSWDTDAFTNRIHQIVYGTTEFDEQVFLARYRQHNGDVVEYFRDRPDDLLIMRMPESGWPELCGFLGRPIPSVDYPHEFKTAEQG